MSSNSIALLPDHVANQIAAGEVVQRPASVIKELLENAIDAEAKHIRIVIRDAGKTMMQVIDDGKGMNPFDARMCFERHATSKISKADDLFSLTTKGFRGEALASIAAVSQVELKTRQTHEVVGQQLIVEGSKVVSQGECQTAEGSIFTVKNLFYNIPARRNFLKNDQIEQKHIIEEVERIAIPHNDIHFVLTSNGNEVLNLPPGNLIQRIKALLGSYIQKELIHVNESTSFLSISGYVSLPAHATRSRKEQFLFVNYRYVRNSYLNHAVYEAFKDLIGFQSHPRYFIFLELNPKDIDINIHPTKTEVKFTDDKGVYLLLVTAIKRALGKANAAPSLNFEQEMSISPPPPGTAVRVPAVSFDPSYNPFEVKRTENVTPNRSNWESLYSGFAEHPASAAPVTDPALEELQKESVNFRVFQVNQKYLITSYKNSLLIVDQHRAHERVLYERYMRSGKEFAVHTQQLLFPEQMELSANDFQLIRGIMQEFCDLGFNIEVFGKNSIIIHGVPAGLEETNVSMMMENVLETFKLNTIDARPEQRENLCRSMACNAAIRYGKVLTDTEMQDLLSGLLQCESPLYTAGGKHVMMTVEQPDIEKYFRR
jgi:DNA mismatch repair protein MutL